MEFLVLFAYLGLTTYGEFLFARFVYRRLAKKGYESARTIGNLCFVASFFLVHVAVFWLIASRMQC